MTSRTSAVRPDSVTVTQRATSPVTVQDVAAEVGSPALATSQSAQLQSAIDLASERIESIGGLAGKHFTEAHLTARWTCPASTSLFLPGGNVTSIVSIEIDGAAFHAPQVSWLNVATVPGVRDKRVEIQYVVSEPVPEAVKYAIRMLAASLFVNRGADVDKDINWKTLRQMLVPFTRTH